jgi:predicted RNA polymerase sigma factor
VLLDDLHGLEEYYLLHSTRGELLLRAGEPAREAFERALALVTNPAERRHLLRRLAGLDKLDHRSELDHRA